VDERCGARDRDEALAVVQGRIGGGLAVAFMALAAPAQAEKRVALVIANND
jgi:hypothetical protein